MLLTPKNNNNKKLSLKRPKTTKNEMHNINDTKLLQQHRSPCADTTHFFFKRSIMRKIFYA